MPILPNVTRHFTKNEVKNRVTFVTLPFRRIYHFENKGVTASKNVTRAMSQCHV